MRLNKTAFAMQRRLLLKTALLFLLTTCVALALQDLDKNGPSRSPNTNSHLRERRTYYRKPGFFRTLFSVIYEQWSDTKNTISKVNNLINDNFLPENAPIIETTTSSSANVSTTTAQYKIKRSEFNKIVQRNVKGLARLFNIELKDALKQSDRNYADFRRNTSREVSKFL